MTIGERIRQIRKKLNLTLDEMALKTEIKKASLSAFENDKYQPSADAISKLCQKLSISADFLLFGDDAIKMENNDINQDDQNIYSSNSDIENTHKSTNNELLGNLVTFFKETLESKNESIKTKNEVIDCKNAYINLQNDYKNEVTSLYKDFTAELLNEKNNQISLQKELILNYKNNS